MREVRIGSAASLKSVWHHEQLNKYAKDSLSRQSDFVTEEEVLAISAKGQHVAVS